MASLNEKKYVCEEFTVATADFKIMSTRYVPPKYQNWDAFANHSYGQTQKYSVEETKENWYAQTIMLLTNISRSKEPKGANEWKLVMQFVDTSKASKFNKTSRPIQKCLTKKGLEKIKINVPSYIENIFILGNCTKSFNMANCTIESHDSYKIKDLPSRLHRSLFPTIKVVILELQISVKEGILLIWLEPTSRRVTSGKYCKRK